MIIAGSVSDEEAAKLYPEGWTAPRPYIRIVPQPCFPPGNCCVLRAADDPAAYPRTMQQRRFSLVRPSLRPCASVDSARNPAANERLPAGPGGAVAIAGTIGDNDRRHPAHSLSPVKFHLTLTGCIERSLPAANLGSVASGGLCQNVCRAPYGYRRDPLHAVPRRRMQSFASPLL